MIRLTFSGPNGTRFARCHFMAQKSLDFQSPPFPMALVVDVAHKPQSRQSAKRFSSRWNWDSPTPLAAGKCAPPLFGPGGGHIRFRLKGWGSPNSNEGTYTVVLYICKYFVP
jgi:hypothetical protein